MSRKPNTNTPQAIRTGNRDYLSYAIEQDRVRLGAKMDIGSDDWLAWLEAEGNTKFYCDAHPHGYTARREKRRKKYYWYAYMKKDERLYKVYMGQSHTLTCEHIFRTIPLKLDDKWLA